jgi:SPP1 gp7 family putative phage head morphogenesis protein
MPTERELEDEWMLALLAIAMRFENGLMKEVRRTVLQANADLRNLVAQMSPSGSFRMFEWARLQPELYEIFSPIDTALWEAFPDQLFVFQNQSTEAARDYIGQSVPRDNPWSRGDLMLLTAVAGVSLQKLLRGDQNARLSRRMANDADKLVRTKLLRDDPTTAIANKVMRLSRRNGKNVPTSRGGTFTNQMTTRVKNLIAGAVWDVGNKSTMRVFEKTKPQLWRWNAVLDNRTCPICGPLDGKIVNKPTSFVSTRYGVQQPPVHANCRCVIMPVLGTVGPSN